MKHDIWQAHSSQPFSITRLTGHSLVEDAQSIAADTVFRSLLTEVVSKHTAGEDVDIQHLSNS